jgi:CheY-like chemotaxis protein
MDDLRIDDHSSTPPGGGTEGTTRPRYRILIVDDDPDSLILLRQSLALAPEFLASVEEAKDAEEALRKLDMDRYDVVLSDQIMPGMNGIDLLMEVKERYPYILRILITAHTGLEVVLRAVNLAQVHAYIEKPIDPLEVSKTLMESMVRMQERQRNPHFNPSSVQDAIQLVRQVENHLVVKPKDPGSLGLDLVFDSPADFNRFTFEMLRSRGAVISDVHVFEGKFHVLVQVFPRMGPFVDPKNERTPT